MTPSARDGQPSHRVATYSLLGLSFLALFLELMLIRWVPSSVRLVAYYSNLLLLSSFLGLGAGALLAGRGPRLFAWLPLFVLMDVGFLAATRVVGLGGDIGEMRFVSMGKGWSDLPVLVALFALNSLVFVPIGQRLGQLFMCLPNLRAYKWDLCGSLLGSVTFGLFSLLYFSPLMGLALVGVLHLVLIGVTGRRPLLWALPCWVLALALVGQATSPGAFWSPYHYISVHDLQTGEIVRNPPADLRARRNPPAYTVSVNHDFYHYNTSQDLGRYDVTHPLYGVIQGQVEQYDLPYSIKPRPGSVLVLGAGGGSDVQGALRHGASRVDAVDIDPSIIAISRRFNPDSPYDDPRVTAHVDDARAFIARAKPGYDMVVFGYLDSQALFSHMSNVRLDGYVYTVESLRTARSLLSDKGVLVLSFGVGHEWMIRKQAFMLAEAVQEPVAAYLAGGSLVLCTGPGLPARMPSVIGRYQRLEIPPHALALATDDWPFLYLQAPGVPRDYALIMVVLLLGSILLVLALRGRGRGFGRTDLHFAAMGAGFMLLETKSIGDCALYFGNTWVLTMVVVTGVLLMVLLANQVAGRMSGFSMLLYVPLVVSLLLLFWVPREVVLGFALPLRLAWALLLVPLPVFFAGLIFSTTFRGARDSAGAFGSNLLGAMVGGFGEYLGMFTGTHALTLLIIVFYLVSCWFVRKAGPSVE